MKIESTKVQLLIIIFTILLMAFIVWGILNGIFLDRKEMNSEYFNGSIKK